MFEGSQLLRGYLPGCWAIPHGLAFADQQVVPPAANLPVGTQLVAQRCTNIVGGYAAPWSSVLLFDQTNAWV